MRFQRRLMLALAGYTLLVAGLFALLAMAFTYAVEDRFIERGMQQEAQRLREGLTRSGSWPTPAAGMSLHPSASSLPPEVASELAREPDRHEFAGEAGRHYHLLPLEQRDAGPWLLAEVSDQLIVRPMRASLLQWLAAWGLLLLLVALGLGAWLARRMAQPVAELAAQAAGAKPEALPVVLPGVERADEIGELARHLSALLVRTRDFIEREQAFSRDASHELRTPLAVLRMGLERHGPESLRAAVRQMEQTLDALLLLARESSRAPGRCAPLPLLEDWVLAHASLLDARALRIELRLRRDQFLPLSETLLQPVLASLLANTLVHTDTGGSIEVEMRGEALHISNPGMGGHGGEGLGLPLVRRLLARQGAQLHFEQRDGRSEAWISARAADAPGPTD